MLQFTHTCGTCQIIEMLLADNWYLPESVALEMISEREPATHDGLTDGELRKAIRSYFVDPAEFAGAHCTLCPIIECQIAEEIELAEYRYDYDFDSALCVYNSKLTVRTASEELVVPSINIYDEDIPF